MRDIVDAASSYQSIRTAEIILKYKEPKRDSSSPPNVLWFHGATGTGKTREAFVLAGEDYWVSAERGEWFDGYDGQSVAIIDDFRKAWCSFSTLLRLLDRYPLRVMVKGGSRQWRPSTIIITCPWPPETLFASRSDEDIGQLTRRISEVRLFGEELVPPPADFSAGACAPHFRAPR